MPCLGVNFALDKEHVRQLLSLESDDAKIAYVSEVIEEELMSTEWCGESDKAWDGIHRCLTDGTLESKNGGRPRGNLIAGGALLLDSVDTYLIYFVPSEDVPAVASDLDSISKEEFASAYWNSITQENCIWYQFKSADDLEYHWHWFEQLRAFTHRCSAAGRAFIFTADQ